MDFCGLLRMSENVSAESPGERGLGVGTHETGYRRVCVGKVKSES